MGDGLHKFRYLYKKLVWDLFLRPQGEALRVLRRFLKRENPSFQDCTGLDLLVLRLFIIPWTFFEPIKNLRELSGSAGLDE